MTQNSYRANLTVSEFPMLSSFQGRTVIISDIDQNFTRDSKQNVDRDAGIPQIYYMHNVMPIDPGVISVGFTNIINSNPELTVFGDQYVLRDPEENVVYINFSPTGNAYIHKAGTDYWVPTTTLMFTADTVITIAHVNGQSYIYASNIGCYIYDFTTNGLIEVTLSGLDKTKVLGICASNGYMIAWTSTTVAWSSIVSPIDFVPSLATGAGGGKIQEAKAAITCCLPQNGGYIIYTKRNAVSALYTNNSQRPFAFREIIGAGGLSSPSLAAYDGNSTNHFVYSSYGFQSISPENSQIIFPQVTDFIAGNKFEDFNTDTFEFLLLTLPEGMLMQKKLTMISNRYLVISYGITNLTHALIYDTGLARWGKIKLTHVDCFEYIYPSAVLVESPKKSIGFVQADGAVKILALSYDTDNSDGVIIAGKYQLNRNTYLELNEIHLESIQSNSTPVVVIMSSIDGLNNSLKYANLAQSSNSYRRYNCRCAGLNHSIMISGAFQATCMVLMFSDGGQIR